MVARVTEPTPAIPYALTTPAAWAEEVHEAVAPAPARVPEVATSKPTRQSAPTIEDTPSVASRIREASSAPGPPPLVVEPAVPALFPASQSAEEPDEPSVEAEWRTEVALHEITVVAPAPSPKPSAPQIVFPETRAITPRKLRTDPVPRLRDKQADKADSPTTAAPPPNRTAPPVVHPHLPVSLPIRESAPVAAAPSEPVIHVTIGRLEVRAPERERKPRTAERRSANAGPSLEQYLAKRRGGGLA